MTKAKAAARFEFALRQRVVIATDLGRGGVIIKRSARKYEAGTNAYLVSKDLNGESEWYPGFSLAEENAGVAAATPTEIAWFECSFGHLHRGQNAAVECLGEPPAS